MSKIKTKVKEITINETVGKFLADSESINASAIVSMYTNAKFGNDGDVPIKPDILALRTALKESANQVKAGDLSGLETMLVSQAHTLQNIFMQMVNKMSDAKQLNQLDTFARIALKAQNQSRSTIATLHELKNPQRATFIKQLNQANQMQVNNSENFSNSQNELLDGQNGEWLDSGATGKTGGFNQNLATVEKVHRGKNSNG